MKEFPIIGGGRVYGFIDAMPGSGKTELFVQCAAHRVASKPSAMGGVHIYCAPTVRLLVETYNRLVAAAKKRAPKNGEKLIRYHALIVTNTDCESLKELPPWAVVSKQEPTARILQLVLRMDNFYEYNDKPAKPGVRKVLTHLESRMAEPNEIGVWDVQIVFCTHEALLRVRKPGSRPYEGNAFPEFIERSTLWFDEARQCLAQGMEITKEELALPQLKAMYSCVQFGDEEVVQTDEEAEVDGVAREVGFFPIIGMKRRDEVLKTFNASSFKDLPPPARRFFEMLTKNSGEGRSVVFVRMPFTRDKKKRYVPLVTDSVSSFVATRPTDMFHGYGMVVLMSAMFKDSQMYHLLKENPKNSMYDLMRHAEEHPDYAIKGHKVSKALAAIKKRSRTQTALITDRLRYIALTSAGNLLSRHSLNTSVLTPAALEREATFSLENLPKAARRSRASMLKSIRETADWRMLPNVTVGKVVEGNIRDEVYEKLRMYTVPPLWAAIRESYRLLKEAGFKDALLFVNSREGSAVNRMWLNAIDYIDALRNPQKYLQLGVEHLIDQEKRVVTDLDKKWLRFLERVIHTEKFFKVPASTAVRGLNSYTEYTAYVHLAALNLAPVMYEFCKHVIPKYDVDMDNVIDNIMQTLYRTNLRDPKSDKQVLMVLHSTHAVQKLSEKLGCAIRPFSKELPPLAELSYEGTWQLSAEGKARLQEVGRGVGKRNRKYFEADAIKINRMKARLGMAKKRDDQETVGKVQAELSRFIADAMRRYAESQTKQRG